MAENGLKQKLKNGEVALGPFVNLASGALIEIAAYAGFDFVILDTEHGPLDIPSVEDLCRTAQGVDITPVVRVRENDPAQILRALDIGAGGVQVPQICKGSDAEAVVHAAKYAPLGMRGVSPYTRAARYFSEGPKIFERLNAESMILVHVEGVEGLENLDEIVSVPGLDVIFLGPYDLSVTGHPRRGLRPESRGSNARGGTGDQRRRAYRRHLCRWSRGGPTMDRCGCAVRIPLRGHRHLSARLPKHPGGVARLGRPGVLRE